MEFSRILVLASVLAIVAGSKASDAPKPDVVAQVPRESVAVVADKKEIAPPAVAPVPAPATTLDAVPRLMLTRDVSGPNLYRTEAGELVRVTKNLQEPVLRPIYETPSLMYRRSEPAPAVDPAYLRFMDASQRPMIRTAEYMRKSPVPMPMMRSGTPDTTTPSGRYFLDNILGGFGYGSSYANGYGYPGYGSAYGSYGYPGYVGYGGGAYGAGYAGYVPGYGYGGYY